MSDFKRIAVLDIGKTNAKVVVVDGTSGAEIAAVKVVNRVLAGPPYPHYDVDGLWSFVLQALAGFAVEPGFDAISITTHGACAALLDAKGALALPVLDYEHCYPQHIRDAYAELRPAFAETASPLLPGGLNLGAQLHYQKHCFPTEFARVSAILTYPQYWAFRLAGVVASEVTSLGCHTDLWQPATGDYSRLIDRLDLGPLMAPVRSAFETLGTVLPAVAETIGLARPIPVFCGIHDSNASLLPHLVDNPSPFCVVSTGTWVVSFAVGGSLSNLDPARDTLANVDAYGRAVASSRFMGGREFEMLVCEWTVPDPADVALAMGEILLSDRMILPSVAQGSGPFSDRTGAIAGSPPSTAAEAYAMASIYMALMTDACLGLLGAGGRTIVEGPLAGNHGYLRVLAALTGRDVFAAPGSTGTSTGAALLTGVRLPPPVCTRMDPWARGAAADYRARWQRHLDHVTPKHDRPRL